MTSARWLLALGLVAGTGGVSAASAWQLGAQGVLYEADGSAASGVQVVKFRVFDGPDAVEPIWEESVPVELAEGRFAVALPVDPEDASLSAALQETDVAELEVVLADGVALGRAPLAAAPYAVTATRAQRVAAAGVELDDALAQLGARDAQGAIEALAARVKALEARPVGGGDGGLPSGAVVMFVGDCPSGWQEVSELAGRFPVGAGAGFTAGSAGGAAQHGHVATLSAAGAHTHDAAGLVITTEKLSGGGPGLAEWMPTIACASGSAAAASGPGCPSGQFAASAIYHNHAASAAGSVASAGAHTHEVSVAESANLPPYRAVHFCAKP